MFVDTHCHLTDKKFTDVENVVISARNVGVDKLITVSCSVEDTVNGLNLSEKYSSVYFGAGIYENLYDVGAYRRTCQYCFRPSVYIWV